MSLVRSAQDFQIVGGNGAVLWEGTGSFGRVIDLAENSSTTTAIGRSEAVTFDNVNSNLGPDWAAIGDGTTTTASLPKHARMRVNRVATAADKNLIGVSMNTIPARDDSDLVKTKYAGPVASTGSLVLVKCLASLTASTIGGCVIGSATAGSVDVTTTQASVGIRLGLCVKLNGTTLASGHTGSTTLLGVFVSPA